ncbi:hypothetical protein K1719_021621 [Acacia pycnantha]|nr:hypothetical protein K1719_021621 [Acacia pycnantha]
MHANDWRSELQPHVRKGVVQQIMNAVKLYKPLDEDDEDVMQELEKFSQNFEYRTFAMAISQSDYFQSIISKEVSIVEKIKEEAYEKIKMLKEMYLPELNVVYQKIFNKIQQLESLPQRAESESSKFVKLKMFKAMIERIIAILNISDSSYVSPWMSKKLPSYEKQVYNFVNVNRPKENQIPKNTRVRVHHLSSGKA